MGMVFTEKPRGLRVLKVSPPATSPVDQAIAPALRAKMRVVECTQNSVGIASRYSQRRPKGFVRFSRVFALSN